MKSNDVADALEDRGFQVVVEQASRHALERREGGEVAPQEALEGLVEDEAGEDRARPG